MSVVVSTEQDARELARHLQSPRRARPVLVVSIAGGHQEPFVDLADIDDALTGLCEVFVVPTGEVSWAFSKAMPPGTQVYGGASRVYPVDLSWVHTLSRSPLRFAYGSGDREKVTQTLIADAMSAAHRAGIASVLSSPQVRPNREAGKVLGCRVGRAMVQLESGGFAIVYPELVVDGVEADRMFVKGQRLEGLYDPTSRRLDVAAMLLPAVQALGAVTAGEGLLARVETVTRDGCQVCVFPGVTLPLSPEEGQDETDQRQLFSVGEVLPVFVEQIGSGLPDRVTALPLELAEEAYCPSLLPGGPPWLVIPPEAPEQPAEQDEPAVPEDLAEQTGPGQALLTENEALRRQLAQAQREVEDLQRQLAGSRTRARSDSQRIKELERQARTGRGTTAQFSEPADQFRFEVYLSWAERTTADDKAQFPWRRFTLGEEFLDSLAVEGVDRSKVIDVVGEVVCGRADQIVGRQVHQLRSGTAGDDPPVTRGRGETCWRASLQVNTPSARRLHYWRRSDGTVELSSVRLHDDYRP